MVIGTGTAPRAANPGDARGDAAGGSDAVDSARRQAREAAHSPVLRGLARFGLASRAVVYLVMGVLVLLLAAGRPAAPTDQRGAFQALAAHTGGFLLVVVLGVGLAAYALWRFAEAAFGPVAEGRRTGPRLKALASGLTYAFLAANAAIVLSENHTSQSRSQQGLTASVMRHEGGRWLVGLVGLIVVAVGLWQVRDGITRSFVKTLDRAAMGRATERLVVGAGVAGTVARGVVFALVGIFVVVAAVRFDPHDARGIDGTLRQLRDTTAGPLLLVLIAIGFLLFGVFGAAEVRWRRTGTAGDSRSAAD